MEMNYYLAAACGLVWAGLAVYLVFLDRKAAGLEKRLTQLKLLADGENHE